MVKEIEIDKQFPPPIAADDMGRNARTQPIDISNRRIQYSIVRSVMFLFHLQTGFR